MSEALDRLGTLTGPEDLDDVVDAMVSAFAEYRLRHQTDPQLTQGEGDALASVGVNVDELADTTVVTAHLAAKRAAVLSDVLTVSDAHEVLGVSEERVRQRLRADPPTLVGIQVNGGQWLLPAFQFAHDAVVARNGGRVIAALPCGLSLQYVDAFFTSPNDVLRDELGEATSPTAWIAQGRDPDLLLAVAAQAGMVP